MKLSIIIPVYNVEKYLKECLESVYNLQIKKEIIIVNDESPDNSLEIIKEYEEKYKEITKIISQKNKGLSGARNTGMRVATGDYIYFLDSDDWINKEKFEKVYKKMIENNQLDLVVAKNKIVIENLGEEYVEYNISENFLEKEMSGKEYFINAIKNKIYTPVVAAYIYKRKFLEKEKLTFSLGRVHEDEIFTMRALKNAKKIICMNEDIYNYRQRENSIMKAFNIKHAYDIFENIKELIEEFKNEKNEEFKIVIFYKIKRYYRSVLKYALRYNDKNLYDNVLKELKKDCKKYFFKIKHYKFDIIEVWLIYKFDKIYYYIRNKTKKYRK